MALCECPTTIFTLGPLVFRFICSFHFRNEPRGKNLWIHFSSLFVHTRGNGIRLSAHAGYSLDRAPEPSTSSLSSSLWVACGLDRSPICPQFFPSFFLAMMTEVSQGFAKLPFPKVVRDTSLFQTSDFFVATPSLIFPFRLFPRLELSYHPGATSSDSCFVSPFSDH